MSDALKRAKAKYYQKIKDDPNYKEKMANNSKRYYEQNKEKQIEKTKKYYNENKDVITEKMKEKRNKNKLKDVLTKLDLIDKEQLAKILMGRARAGATRSGSPCVHAGCGSFIRIPRPQPASGARARPGHR